MEDFTGYIKNEIMRYGADLLGVGDLSALPEDMRGGFPYGICVAVKYPKSVIAGISSGPTAEYREWYDRLNAKLDDIVLFAEKLLNTNGYNADARTREKVGLNQSDFDTVLPHKTVATRAGLGFIGKSALLVTPQYGSMVRISSVLTDAPLVADVPVDVSECGSCLACSDACPAGALSGELWSVGMVRDLLVDPAQCRKVARERAKIAVNENMTICGKCIEVCPYTRHYMDSELAE